jgi:hypothetical protein
MYAGAVKFLVQIPVKDINGVAGVDDRVGVEHHIGTVIDP